mgnify:CR=1 FL=1
MQNYDNAMWNGVHEHACMIRMQDMHGCKGCTAPQCACVCMSGSTKQHHTCCQALEPNSWMCDSLGQR